MGLHAMADKRAFVKKVQMVFDVEDQCVFVIKVQWVVCYEGQMDVCQEGIVVCVLWKTTGSIKWYSYCLLWRTSVCLSKNSGCFCCGGQMGICH